MTLTKRLGQKLRAARAESLRVVRLLNPKEAKVPFKANSQTHAQKLECIQDISTGSLETDYIPQRNWQSNASKHGIEAKAPQRDFNWFSLAVSKPTMQSQVCGKGGGGGGAF